MVVGLFSGEMLLKNGGFLVLWFLVIWLALRWNTQRRLGRLLARWRTAAGADPSLSLSAQSLEWMGDLVEPIRRSHERMADLAGRAEKFQADLDQPANTAAAA
jgi:hypothetical protein